MTIVSLTRGVAVTSLMLLLGAGFIVGHWIPLSWANAPASWLAAVQSWGRSGWGGFLLFQTAVTISGILPASLAGLAAGAAFGVLLGFILAALGTMAGAVIAFALSRSMLRPWVAGFLARRQSLQRLDSAVAQDGWRSVCLLRLSPLMPFAAASYALGLTSIGWRNYLTGTLASLPALLCYVALGRLGGSGVNALAHGASPVQIALLGVGLAATLAFALRVGRLAQRSLANGRPDE